MDRDTRAFLKIILVGVIATAGFLSLANLGIASYEFRQDGFPSSCPATQETTTGRFSYLPLGIFCGQGDQEQFFDRGTAVTYGGAAAALVAIGAVAVLARTGKRTA